MIIIPAVDILDGKCVRLFRGDPNKNKVYFDDPLEAAQILEKEGAQLIHVVDLDAALGSGNNTQTIKRIVENIKVKVEVGGGIRTLQKVDEMLKLGVYRVIFGTVSVKNPSLVKEAVKLYGSEHVVVGIDEKDGKVAVHGWKNKSELDYLEFAKSFENFGVGALIFTPINVDGTLEGPQTEKTKRLVEFVNIPVIASGGVANLEDLVSLTKTGVIGVVVGTAIYERKFSIKEALEIVKNAS